MKHKQRRWLIILVIVAAILLLLLAFLLIFRQQITVFFFRPTESTIERGITDEVATEQIDVAAEDLTVPWAIAFLPDGDMFVTERPGVLRRLGDQSASYTVSDVDARGEGGLLGLTLDPDFTNNQFIYLYKTAANDNRVERYRLTNDGLQDQQVIIEGIPKSGNHDGGRIAFGPDGLLYITTGDAGVAERAQDIGSLAGKILRITREGGIPADNPFGNAVYSYGHRNPQGLAWDDEERLWATEHGRSGASTGYDELNLIEPSGNYGWPVIQGDETQAGMVSPKLQSGPTTTWAPGSLAFVDGSFFFGGLRGQSLYEVALDGNEVHGLRAHFVEVYGRIREVVAYDDQLYFSTSNRDGRGTVQAGDDKIIRVDTSLFTD